MPGAKNTNPYICTSCLLRHFAKPKGHHGHGSIRTFSRPSPHKDKPPSAQEGRGQEEQDRAQSSRSDEGAMSRRLADMTEETVESGGQSGRKAVEEAGFSDELKQQLEAKIQDSSFKNENPAAFAQLNMPVSYAFCTYLQKANAIFSPVPAREPSKQPLPNPGPAPRASKTQLYACSQTRTNLFAPPLRSPGPAVRPSA